MPLWHHGTGGAWEASAVQYRRVAGVPLGTRQPGSERSERTLNPRRSLGEAVIMAQRGLQRVTAGTWYPCPMYRGGGGAVVIQAGVCVYIVIYVYCVYHVHPCVAYVD